MSVRDALRESITELSGGNNAETQSEAPAPVEVSEPVQETAVEVLEASPRARDASGKFTKAETSGTQAPTPGAKALVKPSPKPVTSSSQSPAQADPSQAVVPPTVAAPPVAGGSSVSELKAPASWKPTTREKWSTLPQDVQQEVLRREREVQQGLEKNADAAKFRDSFHQTIAPYQAMLGGADPVAATKSLFHSAYVLNHGPAPQKAQLMAQMIRQFGVDIEQLAAAIDGGPAPTQQVQPPQPPLDPETLFQQWEQRQQSRRAYEEQARLRAEKEFLAGESGQRIEKLMGAIMAQGIATSLEDAYNQACWVDPEVRSVLQQREQAKQANAANASTQQSRAAASSIKSSPAPVQNGSSAGTVREALMESLNELRGARR